MGLGFLVYQVDETLDLIVKVDKGLVADALAIDGYAFSHLLHMGGGVKAGAQPISPADGFGHAGGGPFAVGPGHMDDPEGLFRVSQVIDDHLHTVQRGIEIVFGGAGHYLTIDLGKAGIMIFRKFLRHNA